MLTADRLRELLDYDAATGVFRWRVSKGRAPAGAIAGKQDPRGYRLIRVDRRGWWAHRLAYLYMTGTLPPFDVDHINGDKTDNRWPNLRAATRSQNLANARQRSDTRSGYRGVSWDAMGKCWSVRVFVRGRSIHVGQFQDKAEAVEAHARAMIEHHGEFAPSYVRGRDRHPDAEGVPPGA